MTGARYLGIDFSGDHLMWRPTTTRSNVRIANMRGTREQLVLHDLTRVTNLPGDNVPFRRLASLLEKCELEVPRRY